MLDSRLRSLIDPPLESIARSLSSRGIGADQITLAGGVLGVAAAIAVAGRHWMPALALFLAGRLLDGLDGAVARQTAPTDRGGFLDITVDFVVYAAMPLAFAVADPAANALAAAGLLAAIIVNGTAFLGFAVMAARRGIETRAQGAKSLYYLAGLAEGGETVLFYAAFCLWPDAFAPLATVFAVLCLVSGIARLVMGWAMLKG